MRDDRDNELALLADDVLGLIRAADILASEIGNHLHSQDALLTILRIADREAHELATMCDEIGRGPKNGS